MTFHQSDVCDVSVLQEDGAVMETEERDEAHQSSAINLSSSRAVRPVPAANGLEPLDPPVSKYLQYIQHGASTA